MKAMLPRFNDIWRCKKVQRTCGVWHAGLRGETGFDVGCRLKTNDYIEAHMQEKRSRLYIIQGVGVLYYYL